MTLPRNIAIGSACVAGVSLLFPHALVGGLGLTGLSTGGPVAGSIAAGIQSYYYGGTVPSGSAFAIAQSVAMGGAALTAVKAGAAVAAAGSAAVVGSAAVARSAVVAGSAVVVGSAAVARSAVVAGSAAVVKVSNQLLQIIQA